MRACDVKIEDFTEKDLKRFWKKVDKTNDDECWSWLASEWEGYGIFVIKGTHQKAHRVSYMIYNNYNIPLGLCVCHSCDNPICVNPHHLWIGTSTDNNLDRKNKGRSNAPKGEKSGKAKLNNEDILFIRNSYANKDYTETELGEKFGIAISMISSIIRGSNWKHIGGAITLNKNAARRSAKLSEENVKDIKLMLKDNNISQKEIAKIYNINPRTICAINKNIIWKDI